MEEKGNFINALPDSGLVTFLAVVRERELRPRRSGGVYLHLLLGDRTGEIEGRVWDGAEEIARLFEADDVVKVRGTLERYNGKSQLIVKRIRRCQEEEFDESDFCPVSERHPEEMLAELRSRVEGMRSDPLRSLLSRMLGDDDVGCPSRRQTRLLTTKGKERLPASNCDNSRRNCWQYPIFSPRLVAKTYTQTLPA
jgi:hypothetical protein